MFTRREFLASAACALAISNLEARPLTPIGRHPKQSDPDWPSPSQWESLKNKLGGRFFQPEDPVHTPNPFALEQQAGATQSRGWLHAWESRPSAYAVAAESAADVAAAVDFARQHTLRLVIKGTGHDYLGRSSGTDALLIWTHKMRKVQVHDRFVPRGGSQAVPAVSIGAGTRWLEAYAAAGAQGRYIQGGGCTSVGAAGGFPQGGGFGSFSKKFGTGAAGMLEVEVVTSDGQIRIANEFENSDLFWALRGGGGCTFGVVTRMTLMSHEFPTTFGAVTGTLKNPDRKRFLRFFRESLNNEHWGEQFVLRPDGSIELALTFQGLSEPEVRKIWGDQPVTITVIPADRMWNVDFWKQNHPQNVTVDPTNPERFWWAGNIGEVLMYWYTYQSRYIPLASLENPDFLIAASQHWPVSMHVNKGLTGASQDALERGRKTSVNPVVYEAAALAILGAGAAWREPIDPEDQVERVNRAMAIIRAATPNSGSYANEADYFEKDWQRQFWGVHYPKLLEIKRKYDPIGLFHCHHGVGSEGWSPDGMTRT